MYLVAAFEHSLYLEVAISDLLQNGVAKEKILAVPLRQKALDSIFSNNINCPAGTSLIDSAAVTGTALMVLGVIYGFVWKWGPIIWGLIGLLAGAALGAFLALVMSRTRRGIKRPKGVGAEVFLMINCNANQLEASEQILWNNQALGVGRLDR